jgi:hypothetical protein
MSGPYPIQIQSYLGSVFSATVSRNFGSGQNPYTTCGLVPGNIISNIYAYEDQSARGNYDGPTHTLSTLVIQSVNVTAPIAGGQAIPVSFTAIVSGPNGTYTAPQSV